MMQTTNDDCVDTIRCTSTKRARLYTEEEVQELLAKSVAQQAETLKDTFFCNDPVHGTVQLPSIAKSVIDTKVFQRLRHIRQLSTVHFVYPGAMHCRFMHSIGTAHLAYRFMKILREKQPELQVTVSDILCVTLAGLCHDLGHPCFSHMFEVFMHEQGKKLRSKVEAEAAGRVISPETESELHRYETWNHETASVKLLTELFQKLSMSLEKAGLSKTDLHCILELIEPPKKRLEELLESGCLCSQWDTVIKGRPVEKAWMYEIVSNWRSGVDVDKFDYFKRDAYFLGIANPFRHDRFMASVKVVKDRSAVPTISPPEKEQDSLRDNFCEIRKFLHSQAYSHKTSVKLQTHMVDVLIMMDEHIQIVGKNGAPMKMSEAALEIDPVAYMTLTDTFIEAHLMGCEPVLAAARAEYEKRFTARKLMRLVTAWDVPLPGEDFSAAVGPLQLPGNDVLIREILTEYAKCAGEIQPDVDMRGVPLHELRCQVCKFHSGMGERDPISRIHFHSKYKGTGNLAFAEGQAPPLRRRLFICWNPDSESDMTTLQRLTRAFYNWARCCLERHERRSKTGPYSPPPRKRALKMSTSCPPEPKLPG